MTPVRWILACALALGLGGVASAQECPAQGTCPACPTVSTNKPSRSLWQYVLRLGGVRVGVSAHVSPAVATRPAPAGACCDEDVFEVVGQCAPVTVQEAVETRTGACTSCPDGTCSSAVAVMGSCPCPAGTCSTICVPNCGESCAVQGSKGIVGSIILRGPNPIDVPATPFAVGRIVGSGTAFRISTAGERIIAERIAVTTPRLQSPLQISVKGNQLQIQTPNMLATCDRVTALPNDPGHVLMEGNVKVSYHAPHSPTTIQAKRLLVDLKNDEFKIPQENCPAVPAHRVGLWYAPSPVPMFFPPMPPMPPMPGIAYPFPMPHPTPATTPVSRPTAPAVYYQPMPSSPSR